MNNYIIYSLYNKDNPVEKYIGITTQSMEQRLKGLNREIELNINTPKVEWLKNINPGYRIIADKLDVYHAMSLYKQLKPSYSINTIDLPAYLDLLNKWNEQYKIKIKDKQERLVMQLSENGEEIKIHTSIKEAAFAIDGTIQPISNCLNNNVNTAYGFKWKYVD